MGGSFFLGYATGVGYLILLKGVENVESRPWLFHGEPFMMEGFTCREPTIRVVREELCEQILSFLRSEPIMAPFLKLRRVLPYQHHVVVFGVVSNLGPVSRMRGPENLENFD